MCIYIYIYIHIHTDNITQYIYIYIHTHLRPIAKHCGFPLEMQTLGSSPAGSQSEEWLRALFDYTKFCPNP